MEKPWESSLGANVEQRVKLLGRDSLKYKKDVKYASGDKVQEQRFIDYMHQTGAELLQLRLSDKKQLELERSEFRSKSHQAALLIRKKVKVQELEDGMLSVVMDQEWDTSGWSDEMIEAGCDALSQIFFDPDSNAGQEKKERAVFMIQKLVHRHKVAENFIRKNIEIMIGKSASRLIRNGKSGGLLDLLFVLHGCREKYFDDLSRYNFCGRADDMLLVEYRLAAILIQHAFRSMVDKLRARPSTAVSRVFGTNKDLDELRDNVVKKRTRDLKYMWNKMHCYQSRSARNVPFGYRGPVHIPETYVKLTLEIMLQLVSENSKERAPGNREDVIRSGGCIILSNFLSRYDGPYADLAIEILMNVSKCAESLFPLLHLKTVHMCFKYMAFVKNEILAVPNGVWTTKSSSIYKAANYWKHHFIDAIALIWRLGCHAAGIHRARHGYGYFVAPRPDNESIDYLDLLNRNSRFLTILDIRMLLASKDLIHLLSTSLLEIHQIAIVRYLLRAYYALCCSECFEVCLEETVSGGERLLIRLVEFLEEDDLVISTLSMCILIQLCTQDAGRSALYTSNAPRLLAKFSLSTPNYGRLPYLRSLLVSYALCRVTDWPYYEPLDTPIQLADGEFLRKSIIIDLLRTIKNVKVDKIDSEVIRDLVVRPMDFTLAHEMSVQAEAMNPRDLSDFMSHPHDVCYFQAIPWEESCASCEILEALSMHPGTGRSMFTAGTIRFLGQCLFQSKFQFLGNPMKEDLIIIILNGVASSANALANLCMASIGHPSQIEELIVGVQQSDILTTSCFFISTLSVVHVSLTLSTRQLQVHVGMSMIRFFDCYASMILSTQNHIAVDDELSLSSSLINHLSPSMSTVSSMYSMERLLSLLGEMSPAGKTVAKLIASIRSVHGKTDNMVIMLDKMCHLLTKLTQTLPGADIAINDWNIFASLRHHLPPVLSAVGDDGVEDPLYIQGLAMMPPTLFELCTNLCAMDKGKSSCFVDGFLRRAVEKLVLEYPKLESVSVLRQWMELSQSGSPLPPPSLPRQVLTASYRLISQIANYNDSSSGSVNDLLLLSQYHLVEIACNILNQEECPRGDGLILAIVDALLALSKDDTRSYFDFEKCDILLVLHHQLIRLHEFPEQSLAHIIMIIDNLAKGYRSPYMAIQGDSVREDLHRISRYYPKLEKLVQECHWSLTKASMSSNTRSMSSTSLGTIDPQTSKFEEFVRTGVLPTSTQEGRPDSTIQNHSHTGKSSSSHSSLPLQTSSESLNGKSGEISTTWTAKPGTYVACGISTCGSLKDKLGSDGEGAHGSILDLSMISSSSSCNELPFQYENGLCEVSRLSAREPSLQKKIEKYKSSFGMLETTPCYQEKELLMSITSNNSISLPNIKDAGSFSPNPSQIMKKKKREQAMNNSSNVSASASFQRLPKPSLFNHGTITASKQTHSSNLSKSVDTYCSDMMKSLRIPSPMKSIDLQDCPELRFTKPSSIVVFSEK